MPSEETPGSRAFVLGLDGVPWYLIEQWAESGDLPFFAELLESGAGGPLKSTTPATTPLAWPSIATGVNPDKHGIYGFQNLSGEYTHRMYLSEDVRQPELWDVLSPAVVGNVPMTYPADEIDGTMVTGMMTPDLDGRFTHPPELAAEIGARIPEYRIGLDWSEYADRAAEFPTALSKLVDARRELMELLMERTDWRLFFFVYTAPDRLQHLLWDDEAIREHYEKLDEILGEAMAYADEHDATFYVVSDHGFGPISTLVSVNRLLERENYLTRRDDAGTRGLLSRLGIDRSAVMSLLERVGIDDDALVKYLPRDLLDTVATRMPGDHALYDVDYAGTKAFLHGPGTLFINDSRRFAQGQVDPADVPGLKRDLEAMLSRVVDPETGESALAVYDGDDLFPTDESSPDLVVRGKGEYQTVQSITEEVFTDSGAKVASHRSEGIFLARGPAIEVGGTIENATAVDVAPTLLHALGEPVPENADGRVLTELFDPDSEPATRPIETRVYADERSTPSATEESDFENVEDRLRGLGYIE
jgi:predicted AlkP superfamily phosphohydrolase/phosphomutase